MNDTQRPTPRQSLSNLASDRGGTAGDTLLLLHGVGANAAVWRPLLEQLKAAGWTGRWIAPDLPGHGLSAWLPDYGIGHQAAEIARLVQGERVTILGHSLGGVLALALASGWFGVPVARALTIGIKTDWSAEELAGATAFAAKPARQFTSRDEAAERFLKSSGLIGLMLPDDPAVTRGIVEADRAWTVAADPRAAAALPPPMAALVAAAACPVRLAAGSDDPMADMTALRHFDPAAVSIPDARHNAAVEQPAAVARLLLDWIDETQGDAA